ncbi:MAG: hypothetical protein V1739_00800, partial [Candidatus Omnitrophota bacterium]
MKIPKPSIAQSRMRRWQGSRILGCIKFASLLALMVFIVLESTGAPIAYAKTRVYWNEINTSGLTTINDTNDNPNGSCDLPFNVDKSKAFILMTTTTIDVMPTEMTWRAKFKDGVNNVVEFQRATSTTTRDQMIRYFVVESDAFEVKYNTYSVGLNVVNVTIDLENGDGTPEAGEIDITPGKAFVVYQAAETTSGQDDEIIGSCFTAELKYKESGGGQTKDQLVFTRLNSGEVEQPTIISYWVVKLKDDSTVQYGSASAGALDYAVASTFTTAVDRAKSFLVFGFGRDDISIDQSWRGAITSDLQVTFNKRNKGGNSIFYYYVVELGTLGLAEGGEGLMRDTSDQVENWNMALAKDFGDSNFRFAMYSQDCVGTGQANDNLFAALKFLDDTPAAGKETLRFTRSDNSQAAVIDYFACRLEPMRLFSPNGGPSQVLKCGEAHDISWYAPSGIANVNIYLSNNGGTTYPVTLAANVANNPSGSTVYSWTPAAADGAVIGNQIRIMVADKAYIDGGGTPTSADVKYSSDISDANFEIIGKIVVVSPNGGTTIVYGDAVNIAWTFYGPTTGRTAAIKYDNNSGDGGYLGNIVTGINVGSSPYALNWGTTPLPLGNTIRVKVEQVEDAARVFDTSNTNFTVSGDIILAAPLGTETWKIGETKDIVWTPKGAAFMTNGVDVKISRNAGGTWNTIQNVPADNNYNTTYPGKSFISWLVQAPGSTEARIRVVSLDFPSASDDSANFTIQQTVHVNVPVVSGEIWRVGEAKSITYTIQGTVANIDLHYSILASPDPMNDADWNPIAATISTVSYPNAHSWTGGVANNISNTVWLRIRDSVNTNIYHVSDYNFKIKGNINITQPVLNEVLHVGVEKSIAWTVTGNVNGTADVKLSTTGTGGPFNTIGTKPITGAGNYTFPWTASTTSDMGADCIVKIEMQGDPDTVGNSLSFKVKANLTLTYPKAQTGVIVNIDDPADKLYIKWIPQPVDLGDGAGAGKVNIRYDLNSGAVYPEGNVVVTNWQSDAKPNAVDIGYEWQVPDTTGMVTNKMRVKVYDATEPTDVLDTGDIDFTVLGTLTITGRANNDGGTPWQIGTNESITWTAKGDITPVNIYYSTTGGEPYNNDVVIGHPAGGGDQSYNGWWPIPNNVLGSSSARNANIKFKVTSAAGTISDVSDNPITIQAKLTLTKPTGQSTVLTVVDPADDPSTYTENQIAWDFYGDGLTQVDIKYDTNGGTEYPGTIKTGASAVAVGWNMWVVPDIIGDDVKVKVMASGGNGAYIYSESAESFKVKGQIKIIAPDPLVNGAIIWKVDNAAADASFASIKNIQWKCFGTLGGGNGLTIEYASNGTVYNVVLSSNADATHNLLNSLPWTIPNNIGSENRIRIRDNDLTNTPAATVESAKFTIKGQLKIIHPAGGEPYFVSTSKDIEWKYAGSISSGLNFYLDDDGGNNGYLTQINQAGPIAYNLAEDAGKICYYGWTTPATAGLKYSIKIEPNDPTQADAVKTDSSNFAVRGNITLNYPGKGGNEVWYVNDNVNNKIDWTVTGGIPTVDIYLDTNGAPYTNQWTIVLDHNVTLQKPFVWQIPNDGTRESVTSDTCRILIYNGDDNTVGDESTADFKIKPKVFLTALAGTPWKIKETKEIAWTSTGNIGKVRIYYSNNSGSSWNGVKNVVFSGGAGNTNWFIDPAAVFENVTAPGEGSLIKLVRYDGDADDNAVTSTSGVFTIYGDIIFSEPANKPTTPQEYNVLSTAPINWSVDGAIGNVEIKYSTDSVGGYPDASFTGHIAGPIAANWCELNGDYTMNIPNDPRPQLKIRVREITNPNIVKADTPVCKFKGNILFNMGTTEGKSLTVGTQHTISWTNVGDFSATFLKVSYRKNNGAWLEVNWNLSGSLSSCQWTPGDNDISNDIDFKVEVGNDSSVYAETNAGNPNTVSGSLDLTSPTLGTEEYVVGTNGSIKWLKQGNIGDLEFQLQIQSAGAWLTNADGTNLPANLSSGASGSEQTYSTWAVPDMITSKGRIKVIATGLTDETEVLKEFKIKGAFNSISTPNASTVWKVGENQTITWDATGTMSGVKIDIFTPSGGWQTIENNYSSGLISGTNNYTFAAANPLQDQMTNNCQIRITSVQHSGVSITTPVGFKFIPKITVANQPAQVVAQTQPTINWTYTGTKLSTVDIIFDPNGDE